MKTSYGTQSHPRPVRVEDVAREAGVSPITVSRALRTPEKVRPETRERVDAAVRKTGYAIDPIASGLRSGQSPIVAAFISSLFNEHVARAVQGCSDALEGSGYRLLMAQVSEEAGHERDAVASLIPFRPAAVLFNHVIRDPVVKEAIRRLAVPTVELWSSVGAPLDMLVTIEAEVGARAMGEHLLAQGLRHVVFAGAELDGGRHQAMLEATMRTRGARASKYLIDGPISIRAGREAMGGLLDRFPDCDAVFFGSDIMAAGGLIEARSRGLRIPEDLAIAGYGDSSFTEQLVPALTTIHFPAYEVGRLAGDMLVKRLRQQPVGETHRMLPVTLVDRESTQRRSVKAA